MSAATTIARRLRLAAASPSRADPARRLRLVPGTLVDFAPLARFHYRSGRPGADPRVWLLRDPLEGNTPVAAIVVCRPVLNGTWRTVAWPGRFTTGDRRADALRLNRELRVIARVVVDPRWRGLGLAARLVRAYLARPLTRYTEAIAAMGEINPFFQRAGMTRVPVPISPRDRRLRAQLAELGLEAVQLIAPDSLPRRIRTDPVARPDLLRALRVWARQHCTTRELARASFNTLCRAAASTAAPRCAYVAERAARPRRSDRARRPRHH